MEKNSEFEFKLQFSLCFFHLIIYPCFNQNALQTLKSEQKLKEKSVWRSIGVIKTNILIKYYSDKVDNVASKVSRRFFYY